MTDFDASLVDQLAQQWVQELGRRGARPGHAVGWLSLNDPSGLGLLQACATLDLRFVPLNWRLSVPELRQILAHGAVQHLMHDASMAKLAAQVLEQFALPTQSALEHVSGDVMVVYTSGSTGEPKGVVHTTSGMQANAQAAIDAQGLDAQTRTLSVLPMFHVGGLCIQLLPTLRAGGRVLLHERFDASRWLHDVATWRPTTSLLVPATMRALVEHPLWHQTDLSSLAFIGAGSSVVPISLIQAFHSRGIPVVQVYGATETGPVSTVLPPGAAMAHPGSVGWPVEGVSVRLVNNLGRQVGPGEVGEIWIRGPNVMRGYHRAPDHPGFVDGWFKSGDLGRLGPGGQLEVVGRSKDMIISGGENIYPAEIENRLVGHPDVEECAVVGLPDPRWGEVPVLVVVPRAGKNPSEASLRAAYETSLARFKHPRRVIVRSQLPKTALGKVQKSVLVDQLIESPGGA